MDKKKTGDLSESSQNSEQKIAEQKRQKTNMYC
jgi:hypothetical protein